MSDDEREYSDEEEQPKSRAKRSSSRGRVSRSRSEVSDSGKMSDIEEKLRKKKEEEEAMWGEYIEQRKKQRQKEEEELKKLKERQSKRKTQRAEQEKMLIEMKKKQEEQKQREIEEKKAREAEAKRKRLEDAEKKRAAMMEAMEKSKQESKPNFVINKKDATAAAGAPGGDKFANVAFARSEMNKTKEQLAEDKEIAISIRVKPLDIEGLSVDKLKQKAAQLWDLIVQLESDKYDLEERQKRQDYDLKELNERQRQINRNKALKKGLDPEAFTGKYPPKINVANKFERRVDRRDYKDKKELFEGGWEKMTKEEQEKWREDREKEYKEAHGDTKVPKWDPTNPRNKEGYGEGEGARTYDDTDDFDVMDTFKPFASSEPDPPPRRQSVQKPAPPPPAAEEEEEEYEEEEEEEEE